MRLPISDDILSRTFTELSLLIVQILATLRFSAPCGAYGQCTMFILSSLESA